MELAHRLGYDQRATEILLLALSSLGHLRQKAGSFLVSPEIAPIVADKSSPFHAPDAIVHQRNLMERWITIPEVVRTGRQSLRPYTKERRRVFIHSMDDNSRTSAAEIVDLCLKRKPDIKSVLDIGGGPGTYARLFAEHGIEVTILDRPQVIEIVEPELAAWPKIKLIPGDFNQALTPGGPGGYDLAFMGNILHIYSPQENQELLRRAAQVLNRGGLAAIVDLVREKSARAPLFALTMLVNTDEGGTWTEDQYRQWLHAAGFRNVELFDIKERDAQLILATGQDE